MKNFVLNKDFFVMQITTSYELRKVTQKKVTYS